jgi:predicted enzyme related to lactoylglutathione lyase
MATWGVWIAFVATDVSSIVLYVKDIPRVAAFYQEHFGFTASPSPWVGWRLLISKSGGCSLGLHQAAKGQKSGAAMKIVFAVPNLDKFIAVRAKNGLKFGAIHKAPGYEYANAKDPAGNSISISNRIFRLRALPKPGRSGRA